MTTALYWLDDVYTPSAADHKSRTMDKFAVEAVGTFGLVLTVSVGLGSRSPVAALGIGAVLLALIYAGGQRIGAHINPAVTLAAALWGRIPFTEAAAYWLAQLTAGVCAVVATRVIVGAGQSDAVMEMMLGGRTLVAAFGAELLFAFVLAYVAFSCAESPRHPPTTVWHLTLGIAVVAGTVDLAALLGGEYLVSQVIAGAFTAFAFLASAGR